MPEPTLCYIPKAFIIFPSGRDSHMPQQRNTEHRLCPRASEKARSSHTCFPFLSLFSSMFC